MLGSFFCHHYNYYLNLMLIYKKIVKINLTIIFSLFSAMSFADNHNLYEILELIQKDIKTLEKAVYSDSINISNNSESLNTQNSEDVLTRHLLKLSEIEKQFQELTNKFEEVNFKVDKLSNRLSKIQVDNQIRFQDLESFAESTVNIKKKLSKKKREQDFQDLQSHKI